MSQGSFGKYFVVRIGSRVIDVVTFVLMLLAFGQNFFLEAFVISGLIDYVIDFWGQRLWVFRDPEKNLGVLGKEFARYFGIRLGFGLTLFSIHYGLQQYLGLSLMHATLLLICIFWPIMFFVYRKFVFKTGPS